MLRFPFLSVAVLSAAMSVSPVHAETEAPAEAPKAALPAISVATVTEQQITDRVYASGLVGPVETVQVQPQIQGQVIESVEAEVGDWVEKGQVLAKLSTAELELQRSQYDAQRASAAASIAQAEASLVEAQANADEAARVLKRSEELRKSGNVSQASLDQATAADTAAKARVSVATQALEAAKAQQKLVEAQIADLDLQIKRAAVVAPVAGEVVEKNVMIGAIASSAGSAMFTIVRDGQLELLADIAEQDILKLKAGQRALLTFVGLTEPVEGVVRLVEPRVDTTTRLGRVRIEIEDSRRVRSGMFADAVITAETKTALTIPVSAAGRDSEGAVALKVTDGVVHRTAIVTGIRDGGIIEVSDGLSEGDTVVAKAGAFVRDGDHINPVPADAQAMAN